MVFYHLSRAVGYAGEPFVIFLTVLRPASDPTDLIVAT